MEFNVRVLDSLFTLRLDDSLGEEVRSMVARQWEHLRIAPESVTSRTFHLSTTVGPLNVGPGARCLVALDSAEGADRLASTLTLAGLQDLAGAAFLFHAAGLAAHDGRVIALVGPSGRGKTTAASELGKSMGYVTDETVAFRPDLRVIPFPKPLSIGQRPGVKRLFAPSELGLRVATGPLRLGALALLDRRTEPTEPHLEDVALVDALAELVEQSSSLALIPQALLALSSVVEATGGVRRLVYSDFRDLPSLVNDLLAAPPLTSPALDEVAAEAVSPTGPDRLGRSQFIDALMIDDCLAILTEGRLHVLDGIGPDLWMLADDVNLTQIADRLRDAIGEPPAGVDLLTAVEDAVSALVDAGLLLRGEA